MKTISLLLFIILFIEIISNEFEDFKNQQDKRDEERLKNLEESIKKIIQIFHL